MTSGAGSEFDRLHRRAAADDVRELRDQVASLEAAVRSLSRRLDRSVEQLTEAQSRISSAQGASIAKMRLDRQARTLLTPVVDAGRRLKRTRPRLLVVCPSYPDGEGSYGGQFVRARVRRYVDYGIDVSVFVVDQRRNGPVQANALDGVTVRRGPIGHLREVVVATNPDVVGVHHPEPWNWEALSSLPASLPFVVWVHGYEARSWRELFFNYTNPTRQRRRRMDALDVERRRTIGDVFERPHTDVVFVSQFMRGIAESFAGSSPRRGHVIPNIVDPDIFTYVPRTAEHRHHVLWVRSFERRNYANDLARDAILGLAGSEVFRRFQFTVVGDGALFDESVAPLRRFDNVSISRRFVEQDELPLLHRHHGVALAPSRWDSQGLTSQEAMSSGLVPVTTNTAAIPEFISPEAGFLCPEDDAAALTAALETIDRDPDRYLEMSPVASATIQRSCGPDATVAVEAELVHASRSLWSPVRWRLGA